MLPAVIGRFDALPPVAAQRKENMKSDIIKLPKRTFDLLVPSIVIVSGFILLTLTLMLKVTCLTHLLLASIGAAITIGLLGHLVHGAKFKGSHVATAVCLILATILVPLRYSQWLSFERSVRAAKQIHLLMETPGCARPPIELLPQILYHTQQDTESARDSAPLS